MSIIDNTIVLDTNIWLDFLIFKNQNVENLFNYIFKYNIKIYSCINMHNELERVLSYAQFANYYKLSNTNLQTCLTNFKTLVNYLQNPNLSFKYKCTDTDDQIFLDFCYEYNINYLITRDKQILKLTSRMKKYNTFLSTPENFLKIQKMQNDV